MVPGPLLLCALTEELGFILHPCKAPRECVHRLLSLLLATYTVEPATQAAAHTSPPIRARRPPARPPPALRFGLIFVLLSFCASPCAVIYNLPLLSGLTGSSGVTALAARTASTSQSQQHDGTPQSGKSTVARLPAGGRGARGGQSQQRKNKNQNVL